MIDGSDTDYRPTLDRTPDATRLLKAAAIVRSVREEEFDMESFRHMCGTPSCVLGHYASEPSTPFLVEELYSHKGLDVREHFNLTEGEAHELFGPDGCDGALTPTQAADYIEDFVRRKCT